MKNIIVISIFIFLFSTPLYSETGKIIKITDKESILSYAGGDDIWDPGEFNRPLFEKHIKEYFLIYDKKGCPLEPAYILKELPNYTIEYAGILRDGTHLIVYQMILNRFEWPESKGELSKNRFSLIFDGGCEVVEVIYDPQKQRMIYMCCNGVA